jgi:biotin carboxyl carrier protein
VKLEVQIGGRIRSVELEREAHEEHPEQFRWVCRLDGRSVDMDVVEVDAGTYSILLGGQSFEVRVRPATAGRPGASGGLVVQAGAEEIPVEVRDPRAWRGRRAAHGVEAEGRQQIIAPMPGKIVRVLVKQGDAVEAGQGVVVVEAMKMQNEIRSPKSGTVERLHVAEGQAVNAGEVLAVVA